MVNFNLDPLSVGVGVLGGWASAYAVYQARHALGGARDALTRQATSAQEYATRSGDSRYIRDLVAYCQKNHLAGQVANLTDVLIEPRFITAAELAAPPDDEVAYDVFRVVPKVHDHPHLHAPYNIETLSLGELDNGDRSLALLGLPGSGRTTALFAIALWSLGRVRFEPPPDAVQARLEAEEAELNSEDRANRIKERVQMQQDALQSLAQSRGGDLEEDSGTRIVSMFRQLTPVYVHLANIRPGEFGHRADPAEPLARAVQHYVGYATARMMPRNLYERLNEERVLLLVDGYDDLPAHLRAERLDWLQALQAQYPNNFVIVTGPAAGYGPLVDAGLTPVFLRPWNDQDVSTYSDRWVESLSSRRRGAVTFDDHTVRRIQARTRGRLPFEMALKTWAQTHDPDDLDFEHWVQYLLGQYLPNEPLDLVLPRMVQAAVLQLDEGYITARRLEEIATGVARPAPEAEPAPVDDDFESALDSLNEDELFGDVDEALLDEQEAAAPPPAAETPTDEDEAETKVGKEYVRLINALHKSGLLMRHRGSRYQFRYSPLAAYLAGLALPEMSEAQQLEKATQPTWDSALMYAAAHIDLAPAVSLRLEAPPDLLQNHLLEMARWLAYADTGAPWRATILRRLGNMFVAPNQYNLVRERVAAALVSTRDRNAQVIFRRGLTNANANVRRLSALGLGATQVDTAVEDLAALLDDPETDVATAAVMALGSIRTPEALEEITIALTEGSEQLRQAVAETLAAIPEEGYPTLFEAIQAQDMMLRRAAVFGLRRINTNWALLTLYRTSIEDDQWYVQSAAEIAFQAMHYGDSARGPRRYPSIGTIPWLREWVNQQGEQLARQNLSADQLLVRAMEAGEPEVQQLSALNIGQLGLVPHTGLLYRALRHRHAEVREAAYQALGEMQLRMGDPLPSPL